MLNFSLEVTPNANIAEIPPQIRDVSITFLPKADDREIVEQAKKLRTSGFNPVPHLPARRISNRHHLQDLIERLRGEADVQQVLAIGGDGQPSGEFSSSLQLLETGLLDGLKIGVAGHPEAAAYLPPAEADRVLWQKNQYAQDTGNQLYIVTQWSLHPDATIAWLKRIQSFNTLPVRVGIPGPTTLPALMKFAALCGLTTSFNAFKQQPQKLTQLVTVQTPDFLIEALRPYVTQFHLFPFGGLKRTREWLEPKLAELDRPLAEC